MSASKDQYYNLLHELISQGKLTVTILLAPPRTGSTVTGVWLAAQDVDGELIEPGAKCGSPASRVADTYRDIYDLYLSCCQTHPGRPTRLLLKEIAQHIGPRFESDLFFGLAGRVVILIRNPLLALESHLHLTGAIIAKLGRAPQTREHLRKWLVSGATVDHIDTNAPVSAWEQHFEAMKRSRDYASLNHRIWLSTNDMFESQSLQADVWEHKREQLRDPDRVARANGYADWAAMTHANYNSRLQLMQMNYVESEAPEGTARAPPKILSDSFAYMQGGWDCIGSHYQRICRRCSFAGVIDFTTLQLLPSKCGASVRKALGLSQVTRRAPIAFKTGYGKPAGHGPDLEELLFGRDNILRNVLPPTRVPIPPANWPPFLLRHLHDAFNVYIRLSMDVRRPDRVGVSTEELLSTVIPTDRTIMEVDPVYSYCSVLTATDLSRARAVSLRDAIRLQNAHYGPYFDMIEQQYALLAPAEAPETNTSA